MKNLLIYTSPKKDFDTEHHRLAKIQIDNSLDLGWKEKDIMIVTNFEYQYRSIKSLVVKDGLWCSFDKESNKVPVIVDLLKRNVLDDNELYWYHDFDAYESSKITEDELELDDHDMGLTIYGYKPDWNCGSLFFRTSAKDIFELWNHTIFNVKKRDRIDEKALKWLTDDNSIDRSRYKTMNLTYNMQMRDVYYAYRHSKKPIRVVHFHPYSVDNDYKIPNSMLDTFMYGKNRAGVPMMSDRLIKIFHKYNIK